MKTDVLVLLLPLGLFVSWLIYRIAVGRIPRRFVITNLVSLLLLGYFLTVCGTGIFWVAAQDLPIFDWHYFPGYILLCLALVHVVLHWRSLSLFLRQSSPGSLKDPSGRTFRNWVRGFGYTLVAALFGSALFFAGGQYYARNVVILPGNSTTSEERSPDHAVGSQALAPTYIEDAGERSTLAQYYHEGCSYPPRGLLKNVAFETRPAIYKKYENHRMRPLPEPDMSGGGSVLEATRSWLRGTSELRSSELPLETLSTLLHATYGISAKKNNSKGLVFERRTAPSAGALYPVNVYVVANTVKGLEPGLYYYHMQKRSLIEVKPGRFVSQLESFAGSPELYKNAAATIVFTATYGRTGFKYRDRAYRYVAMDTGHAYYNLALGAAALAYSAPAVVRFDDEKTNAWLGVDPDSEFALLLAPIGPRDRDGSASPPREPRFRVRQMVSLNQETIPYIQLVHGGTSLVRLPEWSEGFRVSSQTDGASSPKSESFKLPEPAKGMPLFPTIQRRRSVRKHSDKPIKLPELAALCLAAAGDRVVRSDPFFSVAPQVRLYLAVRDVQGLEPGVYRFHPQEGTVSLVRKGDFSVSIYNASVRQESCRTADVVFVKTARWASMRSPDGDRGYRYANLQSGMVGEGLYLQATALGLGACGVGAFFDREMASVIGTNPDDEPVLYVTAVGK